MILMCSKILLNCFINEKLKQFILNFFLSLTLALDLYLDPQALLFYPFGFSSSSLWEGEQVSVWRLYCHQCKPTTFSALTKF